MTKKIMSSIEKLYSNSNDIIKNKGGIMFMSYYNHKIILNELQCYEGLHLLKGKRCFVMGVSAALLGDSDKVVLMCIDDIAYEDEFKEELKDIFSKMRNDKINQIINDNN